MASHQGQARIVKRVYLGAPGQQPDPELLRAAAVALAAFGVNGDRGRKVGDPVHEWITEGRRKQFELALTRGDAWAIELNRHGGFSTCGEFGHWLLFCLGYRDERTLNRDGDGGVVPWKAVVNITRLVTCPGFVRSTRERPSFRPGDILHVALPDHVAVVESIDFEAEKLVSANYGGPYGHRAVSVCAYRERFGSTLIGARTLQGWVDLERLTYTESAIVPNDFELGTPDDNPYPEGVDIPADVP